VRTKIQSAIAGTGTTFDDVKGALNPAATDFERKAILEYESKVLPAYLFAPTRKSVTYDDILSGSVDYTTTGFGEGGNILEINTAPDKTFDMLTESERNTIGNFVLRYMFPREDGAPKLEASTVGITFDAGPVIPRKLLKGIDVFNQIFPQNIADSAATPLKSMPIVQYQFPSNASVKSNAFTNGKFDIAFKNRGFGSLNPYGFSIEVTDTATRKTTSLPFSPSQKDGPSVNYLVTSILNGNFREEPEHSNILKLNGIDRLGINPEIKRSLLFDLKRMGDYEQVNASATMPNVIFATIDHLCSLYARFSRKSCIWSNNATAETVLYRFEQRDLTEAERVVQYAMSFAQEQVLRITAAQTLNEAEGALSSAIAEFTNGQSGYFATSGTVEAINRGFEGIDVNTFSDQTKQVELSNALTTYLMRLKMKDCLEHANTLKTGLQSALTQISTTLGGPERLQEYKSLLEELAPMTYVGAPSKLPSGWTISGTNLMKGQQNVTEIIGQLKSIFDASAGVLDIQMSDKGLFRGRMFIDSGAIKRGASNSAFNVSQTQFANFNKRFRIMVGILNPSRPGGRQDRLTMAYTALANFFTERNTLLKTFFNAEVGNRLEELIDIPNGLSIEQMRQAVVDMTQRMFVEAPKPAGVVGGAKRSREGDFVISPQQRPDFAQFLDLGDLFRSVCTLAASHVEATLTQAIISAAPDIFSDGGYKPEVLMQTERSMSLAYKIGYLNTQNTLDVMRDISYTWQSGLLAIKENAEDNYGVPYQPTDTDKLLNFLFSFFTLPDGTRDFDPYISDDSPIEAEFMNGLMLTGNTPEVKLAILLTIFDNEVNSEKKKDKYFTDIHPWVSGLSPSLPLKVDAMREWSSLVTYIQSGLQQLDGNVQTEQEGVEPNMKRGRIGGNRTWRQRMNNRRTYRR